MAIPAVPTCFYVQQGQAQVYLSWALVASATGYSVKRSVDGITFSVVGTPTLNNYTDTTVTVNTLYYYQVAAVNGDGTSAYTSAQLIIPTEVGQQSLMALRLQAQQRCDRVGSNFVTLPEWNTYISSSYKELYDIIIQKFGNDWYVKTPYSYTTSGDQQLYPLPPDFYHLLLAEVALNPSDPNSWVTIKKFERIQQNLWNFPNIYNFYGITNIRYRLTDSNIQLVPQSQAGQTLRIWYAPRPNSLMADTDVIDGVSGWEEYIIVDACIKALAKEESPVDVFMQQKQELIKRIESAAENRDIGEPELVSDSKLRNFAWSESDGWYGSGGAW